MQHTDAPNHARTIPHRVAGARVLEIRVFQADDPAGIVGVLGGIGILENVRGDAKGAVITGGHTEREVDSADVEQVRALAAQRGLRRRVRLELIAAEGLSREIESWSRNGRSRGRLRKGKRRSER